MPFPEYDNVTMQQLKQEAKENFHNFKDSFTDVFTLMKKWYEKMLHTVRNTSVILAFGAHAIFGAQPYR